MKKAILIVAVAALVLTLAPLAMARSGGGWKHGKAKFNLVGKVTAVDAVNGTVTIKVRAGTKTVRQFRHQEATMGFAENAKIVWIGKKGGKKQALTLEQIAEGARVKARGIIDRSDPENPVFTIKKLKVRQKAMPEPVAPAPTE